MIQSKCSVTAKWLFRLNVLSANIEITGGRWSASEAVEDEEGRL